MSQKYEKLKTLLKELFQLDQPDLDFGLYRVMHAKSAEVSQFLDKDLLPQVQAAFGQYRTADKAEIEKELAKVIAGIEAAGMDPAQSPKVNELRQRLKSDAVDVGALESEVYDHLFSFFRRYYSEGDFLAKRVYKPGVYAIPYEGEEVTLHWANKDQYYIKTSEYLRDYAFRLRPKGRLKQEANGPYWFRTVTGTTPDGRRTLIIWRKLTGEPEQDNLVLDEWFTKQGYSAKDSEFDLIYVNGGNNLENLKSPDDLWKVRLIEEDFHRLMFEMEGA